MTEETMPLLPRKKPNILWWLGGVFLLLVALFLYQVFGPDPPVIVSRQTTFITAPLRPDGLPDYGQYLLDLDRDGVMPGNNAAVLLWQALWPGELDPKHYALIAKELGLEEIPSDEDALVLLRGLDHSNPSVPLADNVIERSMASPWTSDQIPQLAKWVEENQAPLNLIVEASRRPRYYSPSPSLLDNSNASIFAVLLPGVQSVRGAARSLATRAMWHLGEGRTEEAWEDLLAIHRLARLVSQGGFIVEQLVAFAIDRSACEGTQALLHHGNLNSAQLEQIRRDLDSLERFKSMADSIGKVERAGFIDAVLGLGVRSGGISASEFGFGNQINYVNIVAIDWNVALRIGNEFFDRYEMAAKLPPGAERRRALAKIEADVQQLVGGRGEPGTLVAGILSRVARSNFIASMIVGLLLPALTSATEVEDRANTMMELTRLSAALAIYRSRHGNYPKKLDDLVPELIDRLPADIYNAKPLLYKRTGDGYLLYSAGVNGVDEGGSNVQMSLLEGRPLDEVLGAEATGAEDDPAKRIPLGADDISIRVPRPALKLPQLPGPT